MSTAGPAGLLRRLAGAPPSFPALVLEAERPPVVAMDNAPV